MRFKKLLLISILLLFLISFGAVNASPDNTKYTEVDDMQDIPLSLTSVNSEDIKITTDYDNVVMSSSGDENSMKNINLGTNLNNKETTTSNESSSDTGDYDELSSTNNEEILNKYNPNIGIAKYDYNYNHYYGKPYSVLIYTDGAQLENSTLCINGNNHSASETIYNGKYYVLNITNYTFKNNITIYYPGDERYYESIISDNFYVNLKLDTNKGIFGYDIPYINLDLLDSRGNLTIICNNISTNYNLTGEQISYEFLNYQLINNYTIIYSGDDTYNGFIYSAIVKTQIRTNNVWYDSHNNQGCSFSYGDMIPISVDLGNATGAVNITINNKYTYNVNLVDGIAYYEVDKYDVGVNKIVISYSGDEHFPSFSNAESLTFGFNIIPRTNVSIYSAIIQNEYINQIIIQMLCEDGTKINDNIDCSINGKKHVLKVVDGFASYDISSDENITEIFLDYKGNYTIKGTNSSKFIIIKNEFIINNDTYLFYFNQNDNGKLFDWVPSDVTLDFQGKIMAPKYSIEISLEISKPINVVSSTGDAFVDLNTHAGSLFGEHPGACFAVTNGGSGSNITGINFHNTQIWVFNATHVVLDKISNVIEDQRVGSGVGATSIRANSTWCTVKNSYFYTRNNGGSSTLVGAWANYCTFDNNTIVTEGDVGNLIYFTTFNVDIPEGLEVNFYNNITNNKIQGKGSAICWGIVCNNPTCIIENNMINMSGTGITGQWGGSYENLYTPLEGRIIGNVLLGGASLNGGGVIYNNFVSGDMTGSGLVYNNTVLGNLMSSSGEVFNNVVKELTVFNTEFYNNTVNGKTAVWRNASVHDNSFNDDIVIESNFDASYLNISNNNISGSIILNSKTNNVTIQNNYIKSGDEYAIDLKSSKDNIITGNIIRAKNLYGNDAVKSSDESNIIQDNGPYSPDLNITAENIYVGDSLSVKTAINKKVSGTVEVIANGKIYTVKKGKGNVNINDLAAGTYTITARYPGDDYFSPAEKSISVNVSKFSPLMEISLANATIGENVLVNISALDISGNINLIVDGQKHIVSLKNGAGSYTIKNITAGGHSIVAIYEGDTRNEAAYASANLFLKVLPTKITDIAIDDFNIKGVLRDGENHPINNATIQYTINGQPTSTLTDDNGAFSIQGLANAKVEITYAGTNALLATGTAITLSDVEPARAASIITASQLACYAVDTAAGEKGALFKVSLKDDAGNPIANTSVKFALNGKIYDAASDENGTATLQVNINNTNTYTCAVSYLGDDKHNASFTAAKVVVVKKKTAITAKAATYKIKTKTKKYVATLKTIKGSSANGKIYLNAGKKVTLTVNGKTYVGKTTKTGKVTFKITKLTKKGKYYAIIKFAGDNTYKATTKKVKITVK